MREARKKVGLTQQELADISGVDRTTIARLETGLRVGRIDIIELLADSLGISIDSYTGHRLKRIKHRKERLKIRCRKINSMSNTKKAPR